MFESTEFFPLSFHKQAVTFSSTFFYLSIVYKPGIKFSNIRMSVRSLPSIQTSLRSVLRISKSHRKVSEKAVHQKKHTAVHQISYSTVEPRLSHLRLTDLSGYPTYCTELSTPRYPTKIG